MHYECIKEFVSWESREHFLNGERIPESVYKTLTGTEKTYFIALAGESMAEKFDDLSRRESKLENK